MPMAIKRGRVKIYNEELSSIKSWNPLIKWSSKVTWNINSLLSLLQQVLWLPNLVRCLLTMRSFHPESHTTVWIYGYVKPRDISPLPQCLWPTNQAPLLHTMRSFPPLSQKSFDFWSCGLLRSHDNLNVISPLTQNLCPLNLPMWWFNIMGFHP